MEKLKILSQNERREIEDFANKERIFYHPDGFVERFEEIKAEGGTLSPLLESVLDLLNRSKKEKTLHLDFHPGNVGWGKDGKLKYIDLESIVFD
jgi:Ser/Thr protein kinase RdoA (MazF antagonist)